MKFLHYLWGSVVHPRRTSRELVDEKSLWYAFLFVLGFSLLFAILFFVAWLQKTYPPDAVTLNLWIKTWGEFAMLPMIPIPAEYYRLFIAVIMVPLGLLMWLASAGILKLFSLMFKGRLSYRQYLNIVAFGFFPFWLLAFLTDTIYSSSLGLSKNPALLGELGAFMKGFVTWFPQLMYPFCFGLGAIWLGIAVNSTEKFAWWKCTIAALFAFLPFPLLVAILIR
jgi:hypothetical protein